MNYLSVGDYVRAPEHAVSEWRAGTDASQFYDGAVKTLATAACWEWTDWCRVKLPAHYAGTIGDPKMYEASAPDDAAKAEDETK